MDRPGWELSQDGGRARKLREDVALDMGGVLQGFAADAVAQRLIAAGVVGCLVEVGGEVSSAGHAPAGGWQVGMMNESGRVVGRPLLAGQAIATSDTYTTTRNGKSQIIDPVTGSPQQVRCRVTVVADDAATADAWATALAAAGPELARAMIAEYGLDAQVVVLGR